MRPFHTNGDTQRRKKERNKKEGRKKEKGRVMRHFKFPIETKRDEITHGFNLLRSTTLHSFSFPFPPFIIHRTLLINQRL